MIRRNIATFATNIKTKPFKTQYLSVCWISLIQDAYMYVYVWNIQCLKKPFLGNRQGYNNVCVVWEYSWVEFTRVPVCLFIRITFIIFLFVGPFYHHKSVFLAKGILIENCLHMIEINDNFTTTREFCITHRTTLSRAFWWIQNSKVNTYNIH